jgi:ABC-type polysaccharide/polyol phosphate export permease
VGEPLAHGVALSRALAFGTPITNLWFHLAVLSLWALVGLTAAIVLFRRRMLK